MSPLFEELDYRPTPIGALSLRRRRDPAGGPDVYEIMLGEAFLMSSRFTVAEIELSRLGLAAVADPHLDVLVGGLGLGYTAQAALEDPRVRSLLVIDALDTVIDWHREGLLPVGRRLCADPRCELRHEDFFARAASPHGFEPSRPGRRYHAILVDIDHSPTNLLDPANAAFYRPEGLRLLVERLHPGGVFALWSNDPPDADFEAVLAEVFDSAASHVVPFESPHTDVVQTNTVYVATTARG